MSTLEKMHAKDLVTGFDVDKSSIPSRACTSCLEAKLTRLPFPKQAQTKAKRPGAGYHSDIWGPIHTKSIGGFRYYLSFTDDCTRMVKLYYLKNKEEASDKIAHHIVWVGTKFGKSPEWIRFDNGTELINEKTKLLCAAKGIEIHPTAPYSPSQLSLPRQPPSINRTFECAPRP
jgi:transposase InsO family protein